MSIKSVKQDKSFDLIAEKFQQNIYGTTKGRLRHEMLIQHLSQIVPINDTSQLNVLDVGGGTGQMTQTLCEMGHNLTLNDVSIDTLTLAKQRLNDFPSTRFILGKLQDIPLDTQYDLVICHAVLEWLEAPFEAIDRLIRLVKEQGYVSISFFNRDAQRFGNILYGNFDYVQANLQVKKKVKFNPDAPLYPAKVLKYLEEKNMKICVKAGVRCFHDYLKDRDKQETHYEQLKALEMTYSQQEPYMWLGKYFHIIAQPN